MHFVFNSIYAAVFWLKTSSLPVIQPLFYSPSFSSSSRIFRSSFSSFRNRLRLFQFGFPCFASTFLLLFSLFFIHNNTVKSCFQGYVLSPQKYYIYFWKKICKYRFRFVLTIKSVNLPGLIICQENVQSIRVRCCFWRWWPNYIFAYI